MTKKDRENKADQQIARLQTEIDKRIEELRRIMREAVVTPDRRKPQNESPRSA